MALKVSFNNSPDGSKNTVKFWGWILMVECWVECQMQYFVEANAIAVRRVAKEDMRHIAKATGATQVRTTMTFNSSAYLIILFPISFRRPQNYHFENEGFCALAFYFLSLRTTNVSLGQISLILYPFLLATTPNSIFKEAACAVFISDLILPYLQLLRNVWI